MVKGGKCYSIMVIFIICLHKKLAPWPGHFFYFSPRWEWVRRVSDVGEGRWSVCCEQHFLLRSELLAASLIVVAICSMSVGFLRRALDKWFDWLYVL